MKNILIIICTFITFLACVNSTKKELESLSKEAMKLHDEVMPQTMKISVIKKKVMDQAEKMDDNGKDTALKINTKLQKAEDDMYVWMDELGKVMNDNANDESKLKVYTKLMTQIQEIKKNTSLGQAAADSFLLKK